MFTNPALLIAVLLGTCHSVHLAEAREALGKRREGPAGPVKTRRVERADFYMKGEQWQEGPRLLLEETTYNAEGEKIQELLYDKHQRLRKKRVSAYDARGNKSEEQICEPQVGTETRCSRFTYRYDAEGNATEIVQHNAQGELVSRRVFAYDTEGRVLEVSSFKAGGSLSERWVSTYDADGNQTERADYDGEGNMLARFSFAYDGSGRPVELVTETGSVQATIDVPPIGQSDLSVEIIPPGSMGLRVVFSYDAKGRPKEVNTYAPQGFRTEQETYTYDDTCRPEAPPRITEEIHYLADGSIFKKRQRRTEEVDSYGNPTKVVRLKWDKESDTFIPEEVIYTSYTY